VGSDLRKAQESIGPVPIVLVGACALAGIAILIRSARDQERTGVTPRGVPCQLLRVQVGFAFSVDRPHSPSALFERIDFPNRS